MKLLQLGMVDCFYCTGKKILITNIGTYGTIFIEATTDKINHIGGTGIGGGTIVGLAKAILNTSDIFNIMNLASKGNLNQVDLLIEDIIDTKISFLNSDTTAANFE